MSDTTGGRHSANNQVSFYRSAFLWFLPWTVLAVVALGAVWIAIDALGNDAAPKNTESKEDKASSGGGGPGGSAGDPSRDPESAKDPEPKKDRKGKEDNDEKDKDSGGGGEGVELVTDGVSLQVLNGTDQPGLDDTWADKLEELGFEIAAVNPYTSTKETIVFWSSVDSQEAAELLGERFGWRAQPKPQELSGEVDVHLFLGADEL